LIHAETSDVVVLLMHVVPRTAIANPVELLELSAVSTPTNGTLKLTGGHDAIRLFVRNMACTRFQWRCGWYSEVECHLGFGQGLV